MIGKKIISALLLFVPLCVMGQTNNSVIEKMRRERADMEEQIARQEKILTSTEKDISSQVSNLNIITAKLKERTILRSLAPYCRRKSDMQGDRSADYRKSGA